MLSFLDILVISIYFIIISGLGYYYSKRQKNTKDFFKGGERIPPWAAGLSLFGTALSPITFMAIPAKTYTTDWSYFLLNMSVFSHTSGSQSFHSILSEEKYQNGV